MRSAFRRIGIVLLGVSSGIAHAHPNIRGQSVDEYFVDAARSSHWRVAAQVPLQFKTYHPQGLAKIGDNFFLSSVRTSKFNIANIWEVLTLNRDITPRGGGYLFEFGRQGRLIRSSKLGNGTLIHPGGMDYDVDQNRLWVPVAVYRPESQSEIYSVNPETLESKSVFSVSDHIGGVAIDQDAQAIVGINWDSRRFYDWTFQGEVLGKTDTVGLGLRYQDCKSTSGTFMLCSGWKTTSDGQGSGGIDLVDSASGNVKAHIDLPFRSPQGYVVTRNPFTYEVLEDRLRISFVPDDDNSTLLAYDVYTDRTAPKDQELVHLPESSASLYWMATRAQLKQLELPTNAIAPADVLKVELLPRSDD